MGISERRAGVNYTLLAILVPSWRGAKASVGVGNHGGHLTLVAEHGYSVLDSAPESSKATVTSARLGRLAAPAAVSLHAWANVEHLGKRGVKCGDVLVISHAESVPPVKYTRAGKPRF